MKRFNPMAGFGDGHKLQKPVIAIYESFYWQTVRQFTMLFLTVGLG